MRRSILWLLTVTLLISNTFTSNAVGGINLTTGSIVHDGSPGTILTNSGINFTVTSPGNGSCQFGENITRAFDGNYVTKYCANYYSNYAPSLPNEVVFSYLNGKVNISGLGISTANDAPHRNPKNWDLYGSNDGSNWTLLASNTYSDETLDSLNYFSDYPTIDIVHSSAFAYIKFVVNSTRDTSVSEYGSPVVQYSELRLLGTYTPNVQTSCTFKGSSGDARNSSGGNQSASPAATKSQGAGACQNAATRK